MNDARRGTTPDGPRGLRRFEVGAQFGVAGGITGLALPTAVNLLAYFQTDGFFVFGSALAELTTIFVLAGAILLAISLILYRYGFRSLRTIDPWFRAASTLCNIGSVGLLLIIAPIALAVYTSPSILTCIGNSPSSALTCLGTVRPLFTYAVILGFWLAWVGGLGIVVGLGLGSGGYRGPELGASAAVYALLLLVLIDPFVALLFPISGWQYPLFTIPILSVLAPVLVYLGSRRALDGPGAVAQVPPAATAEPS